MKKLESLSLTRLSVVEFGQHMKSICENITLLGDVLITDEGLMNYITTLNSKSTIYDKSILQVAKSDYTARVFEADRIRDEAVITLNRLLSVFEFSTNTVEQGAYASLKTVFNIYRNIPTWNYEEETNGLDNFLQELEHEKYLAHIATLHMEPFINRVKDTNEAFKLVFRSRTQESSSKEVYDVKALRQEINETYNNMVEYVLSMSKALNTDQFNKSLNVINTVRKYYADLLAKRKSIGNSQKASNN